MQALAIYAAPVPPVAVDYLLQPIQPAIDSGPVLSRLVNMHFARCEAGRYYLHKVDRDYAVSRIPRGSAKTRASSRARSPCMRCGPGAPATSSRPAFQGKDGGAWTILARS